MLAARLLLLATLAALAPLAVAASVHLTVLDAPAEIVSLRAQATGEGCDDLTQTAVALRAGAPSLVPVCVVARDSNGVGDMCRAAVSAEVFLARGTKRVVTERLRCIAGSGVLATLAGELLLDAALPPGEYELGVVLSDGLARRADASIVLDVLPLVAFGRTQMDEGRHALRNDGNVAVVVETDDGSVHLAPGRAHALDASGGRLLVRRA